MINITKEQFDSNDYEMNGLRLAEEQDDGTFSIYYENDDKGIVNHFSENKEEKQQQLIVNSESSKKTILIEIDVPNLGIGKYENDKRNFHRVRAKCGLKADFKIRRDGVRVIHTMEQVEFIYETMLERYEALVEQQEEKQEAINEAETIEELDAIDVNLGL